METVRTDERERLKFFGRITASATHDLKNVLAIVNENAGLLEDLCALAERGQLTPDRLAHSCVRIREQIQRGNGIIKRLNDFSHTPDVDSASVDLGEAVALAAGLSARFAQLNETTLDVNTDSTATVHASRFDIVRLASGLMEAASMAAGKSGAVSVSTNAAPPSLTVSAPEGTVIEGDALIPLAAEVGATMTSSAPHHAVIVFGDA